MATGTVIVHDEEAPAAAAIALYVRVPSHEQKDRLSSGARRNMPREEN
jgi:predicted site-specific integrase-resolvase